MGKEERICSRKLIEQIFNGGTARSVSSFPLRVVFMPTDRHEGEPPACYFISVPKRHFKHAVDRNRVKRQLREAYRKHKPIVWEAMKEHPQLTLALAFVWMEGRHRESAEIDRRMQYLLTRIVEKSRPS